MCLTYFFDQLIWDKFADCQSFKIHEPQIKLRSYLLIILVIYWWSDSSEVKEIKKGCVIPQNNLCANMKNKKLMPSNFLSIFGSVSIVEKERLLNFIYLIIVFFCLFFWLLKMTLCVMRSKTGWKAWNKRFNLWILLDCMAGTPKPRVPPATVH